MLFILLSPSSLGDAKDVEGLGVETLMQAGGVAGRNSPFSLSRLLRARKRLLRLMVTSPDV